MEKIGFLKKRYSYPRELKLEVIDCFEPIYVIKKNGAQERISCKLAAYKLRIDLKTLRSWVSSKASILAQKMGCRRNRCKEVKVREPEMEEKLNRQFEEARKEGRRIDSKWLLRRAKEIYGEFHNQCVVQAQSVGTAIRRR
jgi:hypothetical protein